MSIDCGELIEELTALLAKMNKPNDKEVLASSVVIHALLGALLSGTTKSLAGSVAAFVQLSLADLREKKM